MHNSHIFPKVKIIHVSTVHSHAHFHGRVSTERYGFIIACYLNKVGPSQAIFRTLVLHFPVLHFQSTF